MLRDPIADVPGRVGDGARRRGGWHPAELSIAAAGVAVALAALAPAAVSAATGERAAPALVLAAVLSWWGAVLATIHSDLRDFTIPDGASLATAGLGLAVAAGVPLLSGDGAAEASLALVQSLSTGAVAFALFWLVGEAFRSLGRDALGFGDVKLAGAAALWLTPGDAALALEVAALGAIAALLLGRKSGALRDTAVPFGAFLAPAAWLTYVLGPVLRGETGSWPW